MVRPPRTRIARRRLAWVGLVVACWGITLGPIVHALFHDRPHHHDADGTIVFDESLPHVHGDGTVHGTLPAPAGDKAGRAGRVDRQVPAPAPTRHGASSLAHFSAALTSAPPPPLPLRAVAAASPPRLERESVHLGRVAPTPIQPRAPPSA